MYKGKRKEPRVDSGLQRILLRPIYMNSSLNQLNGESKIQGE